MRLSLLFAGALAFGVAVAACSGSSGSSSALPSSAAQALVRIGSDGRGPVTRLLPGHKQVVTGCNYTVYAFCFYVTKGDPGPYVETEAGGSAQLYNNAYITSNKTGKLDKKFTTYFSPDPGNPTYQYINYTGRNPKKSGPVKYTDYYCIGFSPSECSGNAYTFKLGIALSPKT